MPVEELYNSEIFRGSLGRLHIGPQLVVGNTADGHIQLFGTGSNQDVWSDWQQNAGGGWAGWNDFGGKGIKFYPGQP